MNLGVLLATAFGVVASCFVGYQMTVWYRDARIHRATCPLCRDNNTD